MKRITYWPMFLLIGIVSGCAGAEKTAPDEFFTSGSREADQRAEQQIIRTEQDRGSDNSDKTPPKKSLYERLGGEAGIRKIVDDFVARAMNDPRVNWNRSGVKRGGVLGLGGRPVEWQGTPEQVAQLKTHMAQFLSLATGGPSAYGGREMKQVHEGMQITNAEFDASVGDLKATLDKLGVPTDEQRELLSIIESTRAQIVEER